MAITFDTNRTCTFKGTIDIYLRTLTAAYTPPASGWRFVQGAPYPLVSYIRRVGAVNNGNPSGLKGSVFDTVNINTDYVIGKQTDTLYDWPFMAWYNGRLFGVTTIGTLSQPVSLASVNYGLTKGVAVSNPVLQGINRLPLGSNVLNGSFGFGSWASLTRCPYHPLYGVGQYFQNAGDGANINMCFEGTDNTFTSQLAAFQNTSSFQAWPICITQYNGRYYACCNLNSNILSSLLLESADGLSGWSGVNVTWDNADINTQMQKLAGGFSNAYPSPFGWVVEMNTVTTTINGQSITGFIVLVSPDCTSYQVIRVIPVDSQASNWKGLVGLGYAMFDPDGVLWSHQINQDGVVYVSAGSVVRLLPIYPPVALPVPVPDAENNLKLFEGQGV